MKIRGNQVHESDFIQVDKRCYDNDGDIKREFVGLQEAREGSGNRDLHQLCVQGRGTGLLHET